MTIRTLVFITASGLWGSVTHNLIRRIPWYKKPSLHITATGIMFLFGYAAHMLEENGESYLDEQVRRAKKSEWYPLGISLLETRKEAIALARDLQAEVGDEITEA